MVRCLQIKLELDGERRATFTPLHDRKFKPIFEFSGRMHIATLKRPK